MIEQLTSTLINLIMDVFGNIFGIFLLAMTPILELRGAIPVGVGLSDYEWWQIYIAAVLGNLVPVPFAVFFLRKIVSWFKKRGPLKKFANKVEEKTAAKADKIKNGIKIGLFLFVAIPLPGTGAWTGSLIASMLDMRLKDCIFPISLGVVVAGIIVTVISYGVKFSFGIF